MEIDYSGGPGLSIEKGRTDPAVHPPHVQEVLYRRTAEIQDSVMRIRPGLPVQLDW